MTETIDLHQGVTHILDNPIWNGLITGNKKFAYGNEQAKYIDRTVGLFAGLRTNSEQDLIHLQALVPVKSSFVLFIPDEIAIPRGWHIVLKKAILQMIYHKQGAGTSTATDDELIPLQEKDIPAM